MKAREGISLAICSSIINGLDHFFAGESRSSKHHADFRTLDLWYCGKCRSYYLKCPGCGTYNHMDDMPVETKTLINCTGCGKKLLYAELDYSLGGG